MSRPPRYITPEGYRRLAIEHDRIWSVERPRIVAEVEAAAALGDRSENAEYIYGKRKLRELDRRLRYLSERLDSLTVTEPRPDPRGRAFFGAWVTVEDEEGEARLFQIVGVDEVEADKGRISWKSPVGRALLGKRVDETFTVKWHAGERELTVVDIRYEAPKQKPRGKR